MEGVRFDKDSYPRVAIFTVESFSDEFKNIIRNTLAEISLGKAFIGDDDFQMYGYKPTLKEFLKRYETKDEDTRKGMIGELIANILIRCYIQTLDCVSIFFNKEERSIKKGYDIVYYDTENHKIWYSEVKSGTNDANQHPNYASKTLLKRAYNDISDKFKEKRDTLWHNAVRDAMLVIEDKKVCKNISSLLNKDLSDNLNHNKTNYNAILISVLFYSTKILIDYEEIYLFCEKVAKTQCFEDVLVFAIHKNTYTEIEKFLKEENNE